MTDPPGTTPRRDRKEEAFAAWEHRRLRASVRAAGLFMSGALPLWGGLMALLYPGRGSVVLGVAVVAAVLTLGLVLLVRGPARPLPEGPAFALLLLGVGVTLVALALIPELHVYNIASLALIPVAASLFFPWRVRWHLASLVAAAALVALALLLSDGIGPLVEEHADLFLALALGVVVGLVGQRIGETLRRVVFEERWRASEQRKELRRLNHRLSETLAQVRQLEGLLSICAGCKAVREEGGAWVPVERYVSERSEASFSHGLCPDCLRKLYPEYADLADAET